MLSEDLYKRGNSEKHICSLQKNWPTNAHWDLNSVHTVLSMEAFS